MLVPRWIAIGLMVILIPSAAPPPPGAVAMSDQRPDRLEGIWLGAVAVDESLFELRVEIERDGEAWTGRSWFGLGMGAWRPLSEIRFDGRNLALEDQRVMAFRGRLEDGSIHGTVDLGNFESEVRLVPEESAEAVSVRRALEEARSSGPEPLERVSLGPAYASVDPTARDELLDAARESKSASLAILYRGELVGEWYAGGRSRPAGTWSVTKVVVGLAVGLLVGEGRIESIDIPVHEFFPSWAAGDRSGVTIRHLLTHTSGLADGQPLDLAEDGLDFALNAELVESPGETVRYNNSAVNLLAGLVEEAAGQPIDEYVSDNLFGPLGVEEFSWERDQAGNPKGNTGLVIAAGDLAKVGQLMLQGGEWDGEPLLEREWIDQSVTPQVEGGPGIGLIWMLGMEDGEVVRFHHSGALGQFLVIYPEEELVGVRQVKPFAGYDMERHGFGSFVGMLGGLTPERK